MKYLLFLVLFLAGCTAAAEVSGGSSDLPANGGLGLIRTLGLVGIGIVTFLACWNSMKIYIAAIIGIGTTVALTTVCMYYEKWFALIGFIALGAGLILGAVSLFVKHKGIFLAWRKS